MLPTAAMDGEPMRKSARGNGEGPSTSDVLVADSCHSGCCNATIRCTTGATALRRASDARSPCCSAGSSRSRGRPCTAKCTRSCNGDLCRVRPPPPANRTPIRHEVVDAPQWAINISTNAFVGTSWASPPQATQVEMSLLAPTEVNTSYVSSAIDKHMPSGAQWRALAMYLRTPQPVAGKNRKLRRYSIYRAPQHQ